MRFKTNISNVSLLSRIVQSVSKINKEIVLKFSPGKLQLILSSDFSIDGIQVWAGVNPKKIFENYHISSLNNNEIMFSLISDDFLRALRSGTYAHSIVMRLAKKNDQNVLSFDIDVSVPHEMCISQDIPISLFSSQQFEMFQEPVLPDPDVHIMLPHMKSLQNVVEKMRNLSDVLSIQVCMSGDLTIKTETDILQLSTSYRDLSLPKIKDRTDMEEIDRSRNCEVKIETGKFFRFLDSSLVEPENVICCLIKGKALVMHVLLEDLYLSYYIPVVDK